MSSNMANSIDDAIDFVDYIMVALCGQFDKEGWRKFIAMIKDALIRADCDLLCQLGEVIDDETSWIRSLIVGYCLCCLGEGDKGFSYLTQAYDLDKTPLTLQRVYSHGMDLRKYNELICIADEDLSGERPKMPRESRLIRAWIHRERGASDLAEKDYAILSSQFPDDIEVSMQFSGFLMSIGKLKDAARGYLAVQSEDIDINLEKYRGLSYCYSELDQYNKAIDVIYDGLKLNPSDTYLKKMRQHIKSILGE